MSTPTPAAAAASAPTLPATLRLGAVHLVVRDVDRSVAWYQAALGLRVHRHDTALAELGDGTTTVLVLHEDPAARPAGRHAGLYHYALLYPTREELARAAVRLAATRTPIEGASDHGTHEAIYLPDPDGNGIELAADRPRDQWPTPEEEFSGGGPRPLDFASLLVTVEGETPAAQVREGLRMGHVHLHVGDIDRGLAFYRDLLGFEVWFVMPSAAFVAAGGYHHHLGFNIWRGPGVGPGPEHVAGLRHWTIELPSAAEVDEVRARFDAAGQPMTAVSGGFEVRDPWDIAVRVVVGTDAGATTIHRSHAVVPTAKPSPYLLQVAKHFRHKLEVTFDDTRAVLPFEFGTVELRTGDAALSLEASASSAEDLRRLEQVVGSHLDRFGARDELTVAWRPLDEQPTGAAR